MGESKVTQIESFANAENGQREVFFGLAARAGIVDHSDAIALKPLELYLRTIHQSIKERIENEKGEMGVLAHRPPVRTEAPDDAWRAVLAFHYGVFKDKMPVLCVMRVRK